MQSLTTKKNNSIFTNRARPIAILWTLLIFFLCFLPGDDLPEVRIPLIDKWAHMVLFGVFTILWHNTTNTKSISYKLILVLVATFLGWLVEYVQGHYIPNRSQDNADTLADAIGGAAGIIIFTLYQRFNKIAENHRQ